MRRALGPLLTVALLTGLAASCTLARDVDGLSKDYSDAIDVPGQPRGDGGSTSDAPAVIDLSDATVSAGPCPGGCPPETVCDEMAGTCAPCGGIGQLCCASDVCRAGTCIDGTCRACGAAGVPDNFCCGGNACFAPYGARCCSGACNPDKPNTCCSQDEPRCLVCCAVCTDGTVKQIFPSLAGNCDAAAAEYCRSLKKCGTAQAGACCPSCAREVQSGWKNSCN